jgi:tRNA (cmo5U34)-methyltransferase
LANNKYLEERYSKQWRKKVESTDLAQDAINAAYGRVHLDIRTALNTQLDWLKEIGFKNTDCLYKYYDFVVMYAEKNCNK